MIYDIDNHNQDTVAFANKAEIAELRLPRRVQPIHYGVNYHKDPLQFKLVFGAQDFLDRFDMEAVAHWLTGHQDYKWLTICQSDLRVDYRCLIRELTPIHITWLPVAFEATIICDCPYAYGPEESATFSLTEIGVSTILRNESTAREFIRPRFELIPPQGSTDMFDFSIINYSDGEREFRIDDVPIALDRVDIDNQNGVISAPRTIPLWFAGQAYTTGHYVKWLNGYYRCLRTHTAVDMKYAPSRAKYSEKYWKKVPYVSTMYDLYSGFNMNLFRLVAGDNELLLRGLGTLTMYWRTLHNVSA